MDERLAFGHGTSGHVTVTPRGGEPPRADENPLPPPEPEDRRRDWAYIGLLIFTAVLFLRPQDTFKFLRVLPIAEIAAIFALGSMFLGRLSRGLQISRITPELLGVLAMGGVLLATVPFAVWPGGAVGTFTGMFSKVMLIFVLMVNTLTSPKRLERFVWLLVLASGYLASRAVIDYARGVNMLEVGRVQGSVGGMFRNPNDLALNMVTVIPLAAMLALQPISTPRRLIAAGSIVAMLGAIVASQSRGGTVGLAAMLIVLGLWLVRRRPGLVFGVCLVGVLASPAVPDSYWQRVATIVNKDLDTGGSREARTALNREAWAAFLEHPLTGVGAGNFPVYRPESRREAWREVHNVVLQVASELGVFGLMVFLFLVGSAMYAPWQAKRLLRRLQRGTKGRAPPPVRLRPGEAEWLTLYSAAISATVVGWFICALFAPVAYHWTFYYVLALAVAPRDYLYGRLAAGRIAPRGSRARQVSTSGAYA